MYEILISIHTRRYARRLAHTHTHTDTHAYTNIYEDKMKSSRSSLRETRDKQPFGRDPERSWCHCYTTSMIKLFWSQPMAHVHRWQRLKRKEEKTIGGVFFFREQISHLLAKLLVTLVFLLCPQYKSKLYSYRLKAGNSFYYSVQTLLHHQIVLKNLEINIYKTVILPVALCGCEAWSLILREECRIRVFENRILWRLYGSKRDVNGKWGNLHNKELHNMHRSPNICRMTKSRRLRRAGHVTRMETSRNAFKILRSKPGGKIA